MAVPAPKAEKYGSWKSPITPELYASTFRAVDDPASEGPEIYWKESRPKEEGRVVLVHRAPNGALTDLTPKGFNVRTTVHEYGGGDYLVNDGTAYFSNFSDQRLYAQPEGSIPRPLTPEGRDLRFADAVFDSRRNRLVAVREDHTGPGQAVNEIVALGLPDGGPGEALVSGNDFYSNPRMNADCSRLAWLTWNHPNMPWDGTELWVGELGSDGMVESRRLVAGGKEESIFQPEWSPDGELYFVSDATGWWNLYRSTGEGREPLHPAEAEFGLPQWGFRESTYAFASKDRIICSYHLRGRSHLGLLTVGGAFEEIPIPYTDVFSVGSMPGYVLLTAGSPSEPLSIVRLSLDTMQAEVLRRSREERIDPGYISTPESVEFPKEQGKTAFAFYYPARNKDFVPQGGEKPPLLVMSHGGPTSSAGTTLRYGIQFWTSRGIAVVDVDYGGSTGYGREYVKRLEGKWGIVDVDDCVNAARFLVLRGDVDGKRLAITGGSAGGYTTLCALAFRSLFSAGASYFGVSDLEALAKDTHKFESRYEERLVGPYPQRKDLYWERSPIHFVDRISCPVILFQGSEDKVVPPDQSRLLYEAALKKGLPTAYLLFEGEQHGFRKAENLSRSVGAELYFYSRVFGFDPGDDIEPIHIDNS